MKSQDLLLMLKLFCLEISRDKGYCSENEGDQPAVDWKDWKDDIDDSKSTVNTKEPFQANYTVRALSTSTGISKSEISLALQRCYKISLVKEDEKLKIPKVNKNALLDFIIHGVRYSFPAKINRLTRGISTSFAAPPLQKKLMTAGDTALVWPDPYGKTKGQAIAPLYKSVPYAVRRDKLLYTLLALIDAIRIGAARERNLAIDELINYFENAHE